FDKIFGYTVFPDEKFNLTTEFKNLKGAKKADGAILVDGKAVCVIELKGTNTKDLESIRQQAFDYKSNHPTCKYIVTSNFEKIRFYIETSDELEEFNLFTLTKKEFELLYLCLHKDNLLNNIPLQIKKDSIVVEENITKQFYNDYSLFKRELFRDLVKKNLKNEVFRIELQKEDTERANKNIKLSLFKKSQKLIDRFLFIFFAEDRGLLPPNSTIKILNEWHQLAELDAPTPLYNRFKLYFQYLDTGRQGTNKRAEIFAYNGGLFQPDAILDSLILDDNLLYKHTKALSEYDFESQVDVNILGHIFENSLNEIESVNAEIEGTDFDKQKAKRKKDGVFYTPKYITKYIVDNTVGKLCTEKKAEYNIIEKEFTPNRQLNTKKKLLANLESYRTWLLQITICDPACGSGAFLNQALDFLIKEHTYLDELQTKLLGGGFVFPNIENTVLENNIFGVDLNEESVEIAKLSLWLRTAQPRRKLNSLNNNIKCGNSLIDSKAVAGNKAFNWEKQFPKVFEKGGFDVIVGNPPYVSTKEIKNQDKEFYKSNFKTAVGQFDLYGLFIEKSFLLIKFGGIFSFITSNTFIANKDFIELRKFLLNETVINEIINLGETVFEDANLDVAILSYSKKKPNKNSTIKIIKSRGDFNINNYTKIKQKNYHNEINNFEFKINCSQKDFKLLNKLFDNNLNLGDILDLPRGIEIGGNSDLINDNNTLKPIIFGRSISKYNIKFDNNFILFDNNNRSKFKTIEIYEQPKILIQRIRNLSLKQRIIATLDEKNKLCTNTLRIGIPKPDININLKLVLGILNSKLINYIFLKFFLNKDIYAYQLQKIPIINYEEEKVTVKISNKVNFMLNINEKFLKVSVNFQNYLKSQFQLEKLSKKLQNWHELDFGEFIKELNKAIKVNKQEKLTKLQEMEWMEVFEIKKVAAQTIKIQIDQTDKEIDQMVYKLYGLTDEEIEIVENS
ncbi:BREX-1 system adenine-specific DNA-methyltransferase PglX, partial [Polaribacter sp.]|nr:BREX-1 system adenine-specific DNA-methyltransferase PglX [Polaribacter sp.]